ncbi:hypothetical protein AYK26_06190 [Euryarchaeota archaeon SM23-78]|nr:MAG: hypothetical protein AYK26_06190 [Euryarchaeota archaeon SM23-78]MBW3001216.1 hypothetical protein [Candidatus Woesearchaeota archaeon]
MKELKVEDEPESIEKILKKTKTGMRLLVKALSEIDYIDDIGVKEGKYWSSDFHNYRDRVEFKLKQPVIPDLEHLMDTIVLRTSRNGLNARVEVYAEPYEETKGEVDKKWGILVEPAEGVTSPIKMREVTNRAIRKVKNAIRYYIRKNPKVKEKIPSRNLYK